MGNRSAEFGHITLVPGGAECSCGKRGCAEAYCSALCLSRKTDNDLAVFFREMNRGKEEYRKLLEEYLDYLAILLNDINMCLDCPVVLGGYMGPYLKPYIPCLLYTSWSQEQRNSQDMTGIRSGSGVLWCIFRNIMQKRSRWKNWRNRFICAAAKAAVCSNDI